MNDLGLVLSGGAARGAYEAGVLRFLYRDLPRRLGFHPWPGVVSGTSVGALNGVFPATHDSQQIGRISRTWQEMSIGDVFEVRAGSIFKVIRGSFKGDDQLGLLDPRPLYRTIARLNPLQAVQRNIDEGRLRGLVVSATQLATGFNTLFVDAPQDGLDFVALPGTRVQRTRIEVPHLLASAGLPFLFPPVKVDDQWYVDGGLRQNTPLRPLLRAGVHRVLVVGCQVSREQEGSRPLHNVTPTLTFLAGKTLNALMLDPVERDLWGAERINEILAWGQRYYGHEFSEGVRRDLNVQTVRVLHLRPSEDLGRVAHQCFQGAPVDCSKEARWLLHLLADGANAPEGESDLLSYLYFDKSYTAPLEQLGWEDTARREEEVASFLLEEEPAAY
jgi:NTE family protein